MPVARGANTNRYRIWQAIRVYRRFQRTDLIALDLTPKTIRNFVSFLTRVGLLKELSDGQLMLTHDLGPLPPIATNRGTSYRDQNISPATKVDEGQVLRTMLRSPCLLCVRHQCAACGEQRGRFEAAIERARQAVAATDRKPRRKRQEVRHG